MSDSANSARVTEPPFMECDTFVREHVHPMRPYAPGLREEQVCEIAGTDDLVKVSSNECPYAPFESAQRAARAASGRLNRYPDGSSAELKTALAAHLGVPIDNLVIGNGSNELLILLAYATLAKGDEIVYGWPSFIVYPLMAQLTGATAIQVPLNASQQYDLDAILTAITPATKLVVLCNPNNPSGTFFDATAFSSFMAALPAHVLLIVDEAYFEFVTASDYPNALDWFDGTRPLCVLRTFSKIYGMAGIRCGYGVMPRALVLALDKIRAPFNVNSVAQAMGIASLDDAEHLSERITANATQRARLQEAFNRLGINYADSQTNFIWIQVDDAQTVFDELLKQGIITRSFGGGSALRVGVGSEEETTRIIAAFETLHEEGRV